MTVELIILLFRPRTKSLFWVCVFKQSENLVLRLEIATLIEKPLTFMLIKYCSSLSIEVRAEQMQPFRSTDLKSTRHSFGKSKACGWDEVT